ncbi:hypothetical protein KO493_11280 [Tamlana agarivorans]|uniref:Uncharacterized protein n=1 Tax=Pseudotamlana agarivorans TaxID=481183 RepID=A0ACC5UAQ5_9FLAO|nr:hypothetical protein [Tamlana agarivorans]MBU2951280.1 hypothetical protein [Tamlana agarivorans]
MVRSHSKNNTLSKVILLSDGSDDFSSLYLKQHGFELIVTETITEVTLRNVEVVIIDYNFINDIDSIMDEFQTYSDAHIPVILLTNGSGNPAFSAVLENKLFCFIDTLANQQAVMLLRTAKRQFEREVENTLKNNELNRLLSTNYLVLDTKNQFLEQTDTRLQKLIENDMKLTSGELQKLRDSIAKHLKDEYQYQLFKVHFEEVHPLFYKRLLDINNTLTDSNLKLASFIKMGFNNSEIAFFLNISLAAVKKGIQRMKHKLNLSPKNSLRLFLFNI